jgi:Cu2+-exporting ATPase
MSDAPPSCFHCGLPAPREARYPIRYKDRDEPACCRGCQAVAQVIIDAGQGEYYKHRTALPPTPTAAEDELRRLGLYDLPEVQESFVRVEPENVREAALILENIVCAACVWLNERHIGQLPGVLSVDINYATRRARVRWDDSRVHLSDILKAVTEIGYIAHPFDPGRQEEVFKRERNQAIKRLAIAGLGMMQVMMYALPTYTADPEEMTPDILALMRWASLVLTLPVVLYSSAPFFTGAWRDLKRRALGMDVPVALGIGSAFVASLWSTFTGHGDVYYDSVSMFVFLLLTGRFLEMTARRRAGAAAEELVKLMPQVATRLPNWPAREEEAVPTVRLTSGDHVLVRPGETIPADAEVIEGRSSVNEAMLTGEALPVAKAPGAFVTGGAINVESPLLLRVANVGEATRLSAIVRLLDRAQSEKPPIGRLADRAASWFVAGLLLCTAVIAAWWWLHEPSRALWITVSVLVITCPCALGLATPAALTAATGRLTRLGLLATRGHALETLAVATDLVLDKTGTLTTGRIDVLAVHPAPGVSEAELLTRAAALEAGSEHPLARAIRAAALSHALSPGPSPQGGGEQPGRSKQTSPSPSGGGVGERASAHLNHPGQGVQADIDGVPHRLGRRAFVAELGTALLDPPATPEAATWVALASGERFMGWIALGDTPRADAAEAISHLKQLGLRLHLVSGDAEAPVAALARTLGIEQWTSNARPEDKLAYVQALQAQGRVVAMAGDGINDAPVLAAAQVSVAMGEGADVAQAAADMVMLQGKLMVLAQGVQVARKTRAVIRQNLAWALAYNFVAIPAAAAGFVTPWIAGIGMSASSLLVVLNALRLAEGRQA